MCAEVVVYIHTIDIHKCLVERRDWSAGLETTVTTEGQEEVLDWL